MTSPTLTSLFLEAVERFGDATALRAPSADLTWSRISYNEVFRTARAAAKMAAACAAALLPLSLRPIPTPDRRRW